MPRKKLPYTANVALHRNGLTIEIKDVPAPDSAQVAQELLDAMRGLVKAGYPELIQDLGSVHGGAFGEADEGDYETGKKRRIGF